MTPQRFQRSRLKGWRQPENTVYVGRTGKGSVLGNPFPVSVYSQKGARDIYRRWIEGRMSTLEMAQASRCDAWAHFAGIDLGVLREWALEEIKKVRGKNVCCWCGVNEPCHGDVILELANPVCEEVLA